MSSYLPSTSWSKTLLERLFAVTDLTNNGGVLQFSDYLSLLYVLGPGSDEQKYQLLFRLYDWEASGFVTKKSLSKTILCTIGMDALKVSSWKVNVTTYDRMNEAVVESREKLTKNDLTSISDTMVETAMLFYDQDGDGKLNYEEWHAFALDSVEVDMLLESWKQPIQNAPWLCLIKRDDVT